MLLHKQEGGLVKNYNKIGTHSSNEKKKKKREVSSIAVIHLSD
jgi:hypothetical protein